MSDAAIQKVIDMLQSSNAGRRFDACEELRVASSITPEAIKALQEVVNDPNRDVADAAQRALNIHIPPISFIQKPYSPGKAEDATQVEEQNTSNKALIAVLIVQSLIISILLLGTLSYETKLGWLLFDFTYSVSVGLGVIIGISNIICGIFAIKASSNSRGSPAIGFLGFVGVILGLLSILTGFRWMMFT